jgi:hypothetical protein
MTPKDFYAAVKNLGLTPTKHPTVFRDGEGNPYNVRSPEGMDTEERIEFIAKLKYVLGKGPPPF